MKKILVTGATGFIGKHLCRKLLKLGYDITAISFEEGAIDGKKVFALDITDRKAVEKYFNNKKFDIIFHLAAVREGAERCMLVNGLGTLNILEQLKKESVGKIIYASTIEVYGRQKKTSVISEKVIPCPDTFYGIGKILGEYYCRNYFNGFKTPYICLRFTSVYGKNQISPSVVETFINRAEKNQDIVIHGKGEGKVDLIFVEDVINVLIMAGNSKKIGVFNIGSDSIISIKDLANAIREIWLSQSKIIFDRTKTENCYNIKLNIQKAREELNYFPTYTITKGLKKLKKQLYV